MKKIFFVILACVAFCRVQAQGFEWVKTYTGPDISGTTTNKIVGSCVDSSGNLYILGEFSPQARLCGVDLLPHEIITTPLHRAVVVAKLSPEGELVWHKAIYGTIPSYAFELRQLGDTAIMLMTGFRLSHNPFGFLYYLDTLLTPYDTIYLIPQDSTHCDLTNGFITFDMDGNVTEQHFVELGYVDNTGHTITAQDIDPTQQIYGIETRILSSCSFGVDRDGNIYVLRQSGDRIFVWCDTCDYGTAQRSVDDGTIEALVIMVDGCRRLIYYPSEQASGWNFQIMKFSPHFDSLIASEYVFDGMQIPSQPPYLELAFLENDLEGNLFICMIGRQVYSVLRIANSDSLYIDTTDLLPTWLMAYNSEIQPVNLIQMSSTDDFPVSLKVLSSHVDEETNSLFLCGGTKWASNYSTTTNMCFLHDTIEVCNYTDFWIRVDKDSLNLISSWVARPINDGQVHNILLSTYNNRVFAQNFFFGGVRFADTIITTPSIFNSDLAFMVWSNDGIEHIISNRNVGNSQNIANKPIAVDSMVYLTGSLYDDATFDTITTQSWGDSYAYIAKYVDHEFMVPYLPESERLAQSIEWDQELRLSLADSPVALTAVSTSGLPVSYACSDTSVARVDGSTLYLLSEGEASVTASQPGNGMYQPAAPVTKALHVSSTGIAQGKRPALAVYPNPARDAVYFHSVDETIKQVSVITSTGIVVDIPFSGGKVDISKLPQGVYYLTFITECNIYKHKIIKL